MTFPPEFARWQQKPTDEARARAKEEALEQAALRLGVSRAALHDQWVQEWKTK